MSNWNEAIRKWNADFKDVPHSYRSERVELDCPKCKQPRQVMTMAFNGSTTAYCSCCAFDWIVE
jgi:formate dehydrogenase maturation protein FdhE